MGKIFKPSPVKLLMGLLYNDEINNSKLLKLLETNFGKIDLKSPSELFEHTKYYSKEMGNVIYRQYISFEKLIFPLKLADIKIKTNQIETLYFTENDCRKVNLDPGYIELGKLVLASTKNYTHRIYIGKGIFAEPTLHFFKGTYSTFPFSYPDYSSPEAVSFFNEVRSVYKNQL